MHITITVGQSSKNFVMHVSDRGIGIPATDQKKIFAKFHRIYTRNVPNVKGTGLGLALVSHIAEAHGGRVEVVSRPDEGSTFSILIPLETG